MHRLVPILLLLVTVSFCATPAYALTAHDIFNRINQCIRDHNSSACRGELTKSSAPMFDRFSSYGLAKCLPADVSYVSEQRKGSHTIVSASTSVTGALRYMRLAFSKENAQWKLDVPESLKLGMGDNWQQKLQTFEQVFLMVRKEVGGPITCPNLPPSEP